MTGEKVGRDYLLKVKVDEIEPLFDKCLDKESKICLFPNNMLPQTWINLRFWFWKCYKKIIIPWESLLFEPQTLMQCLLFYVMAEWVREREIDTACIGITGE